MRFLARHLARCCYEMRVIRCARTADCQRRNILIDATLLHTAPLYMPARHCRPRQQNGVAARGHRMAYWQRTMEGATKQAGLTAPATAKAIGHSQLARPTSPRTVCTFRTRKAGELGRGEHVWRSSRRTSSLAIPEVHHWRLLMRGPCVSDT